MQRLKYPRDESGEYSLAFSPDDVEGYTSAMKKYGIVVVHVIDEKQCDETVNAFYAEMAERSGSSKLDRNDQSTWEDENWPAPNSKFLSGGPTFCQEAFDNRCHPNLYKVFCNLYGRKDLLTSIDHWGLMRGAVNKETGQLRSDWRYQLKPHFDVFPWSYVKEDKVPKMYQAIIAIDDCSEEVGGFAGVPGSAPYLEKWCSLKKEPSSKGKHVRRNHYPGEKSDIAKNMQHFPLRKGDVVIFDSGTCHANFPNNSTRSRHIQFVRMCPNEPECIARDQYVAPRSIKDHGPIPSNVKLSKLAQQLCGLLPY